MSFNEGSETFIIRKGGGKNFGIEYEEIILVHILIYLVTSDDVTDFKVWSNGPNFGKFDDVIAVIERKNDTLRIGIQVKHREEQGNEVKENPKKACRNNEAMGKFLLNSFKEYTEAIETNEMLPQYVLVYHTNKEKAQYKGLYVKIGQDQISLRTNHLHNPPASLLDLSEIFKALPIQFEAIDAVQKQFHEFLQRFYIYAQQPNLQEYQQLTKEHFKATFLVDMTPFHDFVQNWARYRFEKYKLTKGCIILKIVECMISPLFLFNVDDQDDCNVRALFKAAIKSFDITLLDVIENARILSAENKSCVSTAKKFTMDQSDYHFEVTSNDPQQQNVSQVLQNRFGRVLAVSLNQENSHQIISKAITLCKTSDGNRRFHFVAANLNSDLLSENIEVFRTFDDLERNNPELVKSIGASLDETLKISLNGTQSCFPLSDIFDDVGVKMRLTPSHFLQMLNGKHLVIGGTVDQLPKYYISRSLTSHLINCNYLANMDSSKTVSLIVSDHDFETVSTIFPNIREFFRTKPQNEDSSGIYFSKNLSKHEALKILNNRNDLRRKNCHCFEYCAPDGDQGVLRWLQSSKSIDDLLEFHDKTLIPEKTLANEDYLINIVCEESGMGKTWFLKRLKTNYYPKMFVVLIEPKDCEFDVQKPNKDQEYEAFFFSIARKGRTELESAILKCLYSKKRVVIVWDSLDQVQCDKLPNIFAAIDYFKGQNLRQWLASTCELQSELERRFNVLSRKFSRLTEIEKTAYFNQRTGLDNPEKVYLLANGIRAKFDNNVAKTDNIREISNEAENVIEEFKLGPA